MASLSSLLLPRSSSSDNYDWNPPPRRSTSPPRIRLHRVPSHNPHPAPFFITTQLAHTHLSTSTFASSFHCRRLCSVARRALFAATVPALHGVVSLRTLRCVPVVSLLKCVVGFSIRVVTCKFFCFFCSGILSWCDDCRLTFLCHWSDCVLDVTEVFVMFTVLDLPVMLIF
uniref:Uncharacterized protein n=1 Tax=Physcomitrium patens TaxID=3218 RepID=A0A7I3ZNB5_PHYPA